MTLVETKKALAVGNVNDHFQSLTEALCTFSYFFFFVLLKRKTMVTWAVKLNHIHRHTQNV